VDARTAGFDEPLRPIAGFMFDVDGTLILSNRALGGYTLLPGAAETLNSLKERGFPFVVLTNGSAYPPAEQAAKLRALGLPIDDGAMLTPSSIAADLMVRHGIRRVLLLGTPGVGHCLEEAGIAIVTPPAVRSGTAPSSMSLPTFRSSRAALARRRDIPM
jgi:ribonucleotide monophosphatase NagD (HAD superfamily)